MNPNLSAAQFGGDYFAKPKPQAEPDVLSASQGRAVDREFGKPETPGTYTQYGE